MRKIYPWLLVLVFVVLAGSWAGSAAPTATASPSPSPAPVLTSTPTAAPLTPEDFSVRFHPDGGLYVGDRISVEVIAPPGFIAGDRETVQLAYRGETLGEARIAPFGIGGRQQATFYWVWVTDGVAPGAHTLTFSLPERGLTWDETVFLQPEDARSPEENGASWVRAESDCCLFYLIRGSDADRDIERLLARADEQAASVQSQFGYELDAPLEITLLSRVLGHGGFARGELYVSYLDRNYAGGDFDMILHHEMVHRLDADLEGEFRPPMLVEGLAVYLSGGHFKPEALMPRAAALLALQEQHSQAEWYFPLDALVNDFYKTQHEIGYLEAGALVEFMVTTWGWEAFDAFYRSIPSPGEGMTTAATLEQALQEHYGLTLAELEMQFLEALRALPVEPADEEDVQLVVAFYDTVRRYQQMFDPSAYFLYAWLPDSVAMRDEGIVADFLRHPDEAENVVLESLLVQADRALRAGEYTQARTAISAVNLVLTAVERGAPRPFLVHPWAGRMAQAAEFLSGQGYRVRLLQVFGDAVEALVGVPGAPQTRLKVVWDQGAANLIPLP